MESLNGNMFTRLWDARVALTKAAVCPSRLTSKDESKLAAVERSDLIFLLVSIALILAGGSAAACYGACVAANDLATLALVIVGSLLLTGSIRSLMALGSCWIYKSLSDIHRRCQEEHFEPQLMELPPELQDLSPELLP